MTFYISKKDELYDDPYATMKRSPQAKRLMRKKDWVEGWWENIAPYPIYIKDREHLKRVCKKFGVIPKVFAKRKSQGKGLEWTY